MKKIVLVLMIATTLFGASTAEIVQSMQQNQQMWLQNNKRIHEENRAMLEANARYYTDIYQSAQRYYKDFLANMWGADNVKLSDKKRFTQYGSDMKSRETVDFEKGTVTVEVVVEPDEKVDVKVFNKKFMKLAQEDIREAQKKDPVNNLAEAYMKKKKVIKAQPPVVAVKPKKLLSDTLPKTTVKRKDVKEKIVRLKDGQKKKIVSVQVKMVPDHLKRRAKRFKPEVMKQAKRFKLEPSYIFGIMQTESYFNPLAVSPIPAYGLMQIVPGSAGIDAYLALKGKRRLLPPAYLYDPKKNIELGSQYLKIVRSRYLRGIKDPITMNYCVATSYNAGIGNLYKAFTGKMKKKAAIAKINTMSSEEVYKVLRTSPRLTEEARNYVKKVRKYKKNYLAWDAN